jgi:hypothetical protein
MDLEPANSMPSCSVLYCIVRGNTNCSTAQSAAVPAAMRCQYYTVAADDVLQAVCGCRVFLLLVA